MFWSSGQQPLDAVFQRHHPACSMRAMAVRRGDAGQRADATVACSSGIRDERKAGVVGVRVSASAAITAAGACSLAGPPARCSTDKIGLRGVGRHQMAVRRGVAPMQPTWCWSRRLNSARGTRPGHTALAITAARCKHQADPLQRDVARSPQVSPGPAAVGGS